MAFSNAILRTFSFAAGRLLLHTHRQFSFIDQTWLISFHNVHNWLLLCNLFPTLEIVDL